MCGVWGVWGVWGVDGVDTLSCGVPRSYAGMYAGVCGVVACELGVGT